MTTHTHWKKLTNPDYLGAYSIDDGQDLILTIRKVVQESVTGSDGKKEECIVCYFAEDVKPMILNVTNCKAITKLTGTPFIEEWAGHKIQVGVERVKAFGDVVDALRVRKFKPKEAAQSKPVACELCGQVIKPAFGMSVPQWIEYTKANGKGTICADCAKKDAAQAKQSAAEPTNAGQVSGDA
ncbi:MAG: hypothetical protein II642_06035 [Firmicutes bacterium]|nr:hypothetical protein [Bacillota bacterium]